MAIIFDLDGTLIDSFGVHYKLIKEAMDEILGKDLVPLEVIKENIRFPSKEMLNLLNKKFSLGLTNSQMFEIIRLKDEKFTDKYIKKIKFYPDAKNMLRFLKAKKIKFCIATSMNTEELNKVKPYLKLKYIKIVNSEALKHEKPDPYIINKAIKILNVNKKNTFYVGDAETDYTASLNAKVKFIGVNNPDLKTRGAFYFKDIKSLFSFIKEGYRDFF